MVSVRKIATCLLVGTLAFAGPTGTARAAQSPAVGIDLSLTEVGTQDGNVDLQTQLQSNLKAQEIGLAFAKVNVYVNIRSEANTDSKVVGKLYKNNICSILKKEGEWYQIKSGSVTGYIKAEFLITGKKAEDYSKKVGSTLATINAKTLRVREKASRKSSVLTLVSRGKEYKVTKEKDDWVKIVVDGTTTGYVSKDYIKLKKVYSQAISVQEEQAMLAAEAEEVQSASLMTLKSVESSKKDTSKKELVSSSDADADSTLRSQIAEFARRFEGNPYVWGGTSLTRGADCSGFTQSVLENFRIDIPRTSREQAVSGNRVGLDEIKPGDLIFYRRNGIINHVALYIGNGKVIGAKSRSEGIRISNYNYRTPYKAVSYID